MNEDRASIDKKAVVRTRFAPSPTGALHAGTVRTALFAWLVARHHDGQFLLRIEDTDQAREVEGAVVNITSTLAYMGIDWDEGPDKGGPHGPYTQSERLDIYREWAQKLVDAGRAYADPYTPEEVNAFREKAKAEKRPFLFRDHRPKNPPKWDGSQPLRLKSEPREYTWHDEVMGELHAGPEVIDDFILMKSDGFPTYNFAHIIDDHLMKITHVVRSQEFLSSVPKYLNLYDALGIAWPTFATVPAVLDPDGKQKLSKRKGAKQLLEYKAMGIPSEALMNFLVTLGWNDGTEQEIFTRHEIIEKFDITRVQKSGAKFDEQRLLWISGRHIRDMTLETLYVKIEDFWPPEAKSYDELYKKRVLKLVQERLKYYAELPELTLFFFTDLPLDSELITGHKQLKKLSNDELKELLATSRAALEQSDFTEENLTGHLNNLLEITGQKPAVLFSLIRIATTQSPASPGLAETLAVLGKEVSLRRMDEQIAAL